MDSLFSPSFSIGLPPFSRFVNYLIFRFSIPFPQKYILSIFINLLFFLLSPSSIPPFSKKYRIICLYLFSQCFLSIVFITFFSPKIYSLNFSIPPFSRKCILIIFLYFILLDFLFSLIFLFII